MAYTDMRGLPISTTSSEALAAYERGVDLFLRWRGGALEALNAATNHDPHFALAHCTKAFMGWRMGNVNVALDGHQGAMAAANDLHSEREQLHVQAVDAMHRGEPLAADELLTQIGAQYPTDRLAVRLLGFICIARGDYLAGLEIANRSLDACPDDTQFQTMKGFFLEQSGHNAEGFAYSSRALASDPGNLYAYHAVGHAYISRGDYREALETFERAASLEHYPHILWHLGEARAILGYEQFTRDYWAHTSPALPLFERIELLWRLEVLRQLPVDVTTWKDLAEQAEHLLVHPEYLTIWMHHWIGLALARAGYVEQARRRRGQGPWPLVHPRSRLARGRVGVHAGELRRCGTVHGPGGATDPCHGWGQPRAERYLQGCLSGAPTPPRTYGSGHRVSPAASAHQSPPYPVAGRPGVGIRPDRTEVAAAASLSAAHQQSGGSTAPSPGPRAF